MFFLGMCCLNLIRHAQQQNPDGDEFHAKWQADTDKLNNMHTMTVVELEQFMKNAPPTWSDFKRRVKWLDSYKAQWAELQRIVLALRELSEGRRQWDPNYQGDLGNLMLHKLPAFVNVRSRYLSNVEMFDDNLKQWSADYHRLQKSYVDVLKNKSKINLKVLWNDLQKVTENQFLIARQLEQVKEWKRKFDQSADRLSFNRPSAGNMASP